jgi:hypothetical protein
VHEEHDLLGKPHGEYLPLAAELFNNSFACSTVSSSTGAALTLSFTLTVDYCDL